MASCPHSILVSNPAENRYTKEKMWVPCGKCPVCIANRANDWAVRLHHQAKISFSVYFVTLTYALPPLTANGLPTIVKSHFQDFMKRLRKAELQDGNTDKLVYYAAGEYGEINERPHYHMIIFNIRNERNILKSWTLNGKVLGMVDVQKPKSVASFKYTAGYIGKKIGIPQYDKDDRCKEFSLMSKKIGLHYVNMFGKHYSDTLTSFTYLQGHKVALPRYYKNKIFSHEQKAIIYAEQQKRYLQSCEDKATLKRPNPSLFIRNLNAARKAAPKTAIADRSKSGRNL